MSAGFAADAPEAALSALFVPFDSGVLKLPPDGRALCLRARAGVRLRETAQPGWLCEQSFLPFADELARCGLRVGEASPGETFPLVLLLPPRQRDEARALFVRALDHLAPGGTLVASMAKAEGAKSGEADLARLAGSVGNLSKHHCRVFWTTPKPDDVDRALQDAWRALDAPRETADGWWSRPGLFAWDRVDRASALLAAHFPEDLHGRMADLGAGYGYLSAQLIERCPRLAALDMYEAEERAFGPLHRNVGHAVAKAGRGLHMNVYWHDVTRGLLDRYDVIVSNPPFHLGRADLPQLGRAFIASAADALTPQGRLLIVANRHLPYEALLGARFAEVRQLALQDGFKVIEARGVRA
ncbi:MAG: class I SAM-dependent methyltransferase [Rhodanobacter sp.]